MANKTFNKSRGYTEKVDIGISGNINHQHNIVHIDNLNLPIETRKQILDELRRAKQIPSRVIGNDENLAPALASNNGNDEE